MTQKFENLDVWQKAKALTVMVYRLTQKYPNQEKFALISQTTRAVVSIACNIAEGSSRTSKKDFRHFLEIAIGSAFELETLLIIADELDYISKKEKESVIDNIMVIEKMLNGLMRSLNEQSANS